MLSGAGISTDGVSKIASGSEDDPYSAYQFNGRFGFDINDNTEVFFIGYYNKADMDYDGYVNGKYGDTPRQREDRVLHQHRGPDQRAVFLVEPQADRSPTARWTTTTATTPPTSPT